MDAHGELARSNSGAEAFSQNTETANITIDRALELFASAKAERSIALAHEARQMIENIERPLTEDEATYHHHICVLIDELGKEDIQES